jgi:hypothetical protein
VETGRNPPGPTPLAIVAQGNYIAVNGTQETSFYPGNNTGSFLRNTSFKIPQILDGLSNTLFVGEHNMGHSNTTWVGTVPGAGVPALKDIDPFGTQAMGQALVLNHGHRTHLPNDPFVTDPEAAPACLGPGFRLETDLQQLELDTGLCNWVTLSGSALFDVSGGQQLELEFSHYNLEAAAPATAELKLAFPDCEVWKKQLAIPGAAEVYREQFASPCALKAGQSVLFHLHNHGQNTYQVQDLAVLR